MLPPDDSSHEPTPPSTSGDTPEGQPRHPFTYRSPAERPAELPPLTADDVADEARRNDKVLVWAAGLMAVVFACTTVADSRTLVHVKTGRALAAQGVLPPQNDFLSATASEHAWINLHWLFDLALAGLHSLGGFAALSLLQVVVAVSVVAFLLSCRGGATSSWWAAVVAVLAAIAAIPQLAARNELVTLLGLAATLWMLTKYRREQSETIVWWLIPLFLVWSNLDSRMFLGLAVLLLYGLGELAGSTIGRPAFEDGSRRTRYWLASGGALLASFVNPFTWQAPFGAWQLYGVTDPAYREHYTGETAWAVLPHLPLWMIPREAMFDTALLVGLLLAAVAAITLLLNRRKADPGDLALWLGFAGFGIAAGREWSAGAIVFAVLAIQNAEAWYRATFRQEYGTERNELIFSRGGRAVTVLAFAALAAFWMLGRIVADDGRRPGVGLDAVLAGQIESYEAARAAAYDDGVFNFNAMQGDLLIWVGLRPFIDHRLGMFASAGASNDDDLVALHDTVRHALRAEQDAAEWGRPDLWKPALDRFSIVHAVPRLTMPNPDYFSYFDLLRAPDWRLIDLGAASALFCRSDTADAAIEAYLVSSQSNLMKAAFREPLQVPANPGVWPRRRTWTDGLTRPAPPSNELAHGYHCLQHLEMVESQQLSLSISTVYAFAYLAMRDFYAALADDPQNVAAFRGLGRVFMFLYQRESGDTGGPMQRRLYQALGAYGQARTISPDDPVSHEQIIPIYLNFNKLDLALKSFDEYRRLTGVDPPKPEGETTAAQWDAVWNDVRTEVRTIRTEAARFLKEGQPRLNVVLFAWQRGCTLEALALIDADPAFLDENPQARRLQAILMLEAARPREAFERLIEVEQSASSQGLTVFREPLAYASLALPDYERAKALWQDMSLESSENQLLRAMNTVPLTGNLNVAGTFPTWQIVESARALDEASQSVAQSEFNAALCDLEAGHAEEADKALSSLLEKRPLTRFSPLADFYLEQLREEPVAIRIDLGKSDAMFDDVEARFDAAIVRAQLNAAGPVTAPKPPPKSP